MTLSTLIRKREVATATVGTQKPSNHPSVASVASVNVAIEKDGKPETLPDKQGKGQRQNVIDIQRATSGTQQVIAVANDYNPAERYPAEGEYWRDFEIISVGEAVLLALGIEPRDFRDPDDEKNGLRDGLQEREYLRMVAVIRNAIAAKVLAKAVTDDPAYSDHVGFKGFVAWAEGKGWPMPEWMLGIIAPQAKPVTPSDQVMPPTPSGIREIKKAETAARHLQWQARYDQLRAENPKWKPSQIIKKVAAEFDVSAKTIRNNIKIR
jgi:hypothetical protein